MEALADKGLNIFSKDGVNFNIFVAFFNRDPGDVVSHRFGPPNPRELIEVCEIAYVELGRVIQGVCPNAIVATGTISGIAFALPESTPLNLLDTVVTDYDCVFMPYSEAIDKRNHETFWIQLAGFPF